MHHDWRWTRIHGLVRQLHQLCEYLLSFVVVLPSLCDGQWSMRLRWRGGSLRLLCTLEGRIDLTPSSQPSIQEGIGLSRIQRRNLYPRLLHRFRLNGMYPSLGILRRRSSVSVCGKFMLEYTSGLSLSTEPFQANPENLNG